MWRLFRAISTVLLVAGLLFFQNCGTPFKTEVVNDDFCARNPMDQACMQSQKAQCSFNGVTLSDGQSVTAYLNSAVPSGNTCASETRTCEDGVLSGSYAFASCSVNAPGSCLFDGKEVTHGTTIKAYQNSSVPFGQSCVSQNRTCSNGVLSGSYSYGMCVVGAPSSCLFNGQTIAHGASVNAFTASTVPFGQTCVPQQRTCYNGVLSGQGNFASCSVNQAAACLFNGQTVAHGQTINAYTTSSVPFGQSCQPRVRTCSNGTLSGSGNYASCVVGQPASCLINGLTIAHGSSITLFKAAQATLERPCESEVRVCQNGTLSGTATHNSCSIPCPAMIRGLTGLRTPKATDQIRFGTEVLTYPTGYAWMRSGKQFSEYENHYRSITYHMTSGDCGATWTRSDELNGFKLDGRPEDIGNGPAGAVFNPEAAPLNRGFFHHINWQNWARGRIYPYFDFGSGLEYQALTANKQEISPVIGSTDLTKKDHFYSPSPVANSDGSVKVYFGGWRDMQFQSWQKPRCSVRNFTPSAGPIEKDCWCDEAAPANVSLDMCSGDRIYVATNQNDNNALNYKVFSADGTFSTSARGPSGNFEPIIYPALVNNTCPASRCPHKISHANDPSVIRTKSGLYVMYFTAGVGTFITPGKMLNYTYVATSADGIHFSNFSALKKHPSGSAYFPFGLAYNQANGTAKAFYDSYRDRIYLSFVATPDSPEVANVENHPDAWNLMVHQIMASQPELVVTTTRVGHTNNLFVAPKGTSFRANPAN